MFVVIRYIGLCWVVTSALLGSTFVPGPLEVSTVVYLLTSWTFVLFFCATDLVMILRVYTLWKRSKAILYILLFIFLVKTIIDIVFTGIYVNPNTHLSVTVVRVFDISFCNVSFVNGPPTRGFFIAVVVLPGLLLAAQRHRNSNQCYTHPGVTWLYTGLHTRPTVYDRHTRTI
ncbi:hypothetical protein L210DRAFT_3563686 [Boletus edulis BED1]|uniref:Uncharacterized protein n=1 Tax=Boletus edulis BED1 TaxID=1328754 RepID=A0AAD4G7Z6_BOLED|nr:hypothetical protein L210DRAFT_3563686 [Boletus edulis BED1]